MIHLLNLKELHLEHFSALHNAGISSESIKLAHPMRHLGITSGGVNAVLEMWNFNFHGNNWETLLMKGYPIYSIKKI